MTCAISAILEQELQSSTDLIASFEGHESLWYHRRFVLSGFQKICASELCVKQDLSRFSLILASDNVFLQKCSLESQNPHQLRHVHQHLDWLRSVLKVALP
jgi:hypothetical protein